VAEVPVGCVFAVDGVVIASGRNYVNEKMDVRANPRGLPVLAPARACWLAAGPSCVGRAGFA
jgi:hypothetical protein